MHGVLLNNWGVKKSLLVTVCLLYTCQGDNIAIVGDIILRSPLVTSLWGDAHLFFRHQDMREDFILHPEWDQYTDKFAGGLIPTEC